MSAAEKDQKSADSVVIFLVGESYNGEHGDRRSTDPEIAEELVKAGLARYAKSKP